MFQPKDKLAEWIQKQDPYIYCLQETHFRPKDTYRLKVRGWKNIFHANGNQKKAGVKVKSFSRVQLFVIPWTVAYQPPQSMEFSRQKYWSGLSFPSLGDLSNPGIEPRSPALQADALPSEPPGKPK